MNEQNNAPKHAMLEQNLALAENPLNNPAYTIHTNHLALHKLDEKNLPLTANACNPIIELMMKDFNGANRFHLPIWATWRNVFAISTRKRLLLSLTLAF